MPAKRKAPVDEPPIGRVLEAVDRDLQKIARVSAELADSTLAATAREMASQLDDPGNSATSKSMCARVLSDVMEQLRELTPEGDDKDGVDELNARRAARRRTAA